MTDNMTIGAFLLSKATNMRNWLETETSWRATVPLTELTVTAMAAKVHEIRPVLEARDWAELERRAAELKTPELSDALDALRGRFDLHDKFWRYLMLFSDVMATH